MSDCFKYVLIFAFVNLSVISPCDNQTKSKISVVDSWCIKLLDGAKKQIGKTLRYDPTYQRLDYPNGDVPVEYGVCTDVIVRAFRSIGVDLQKLIHEDMKKNWSMYPKLWGLKGPDKNIDHRRVPNLAKFFTRIGMLNKDPNFLPGDLVIWDLGGGILHVGILSEKKEAGDYLVVHNISSGAKQENILNVYKIVQKFRINETALKKLKII